jgi:hypothetical protein
MVIIPIPFFVNPYTKKEDVRDVVNGQRKASALVLFALAIVLGLMQLLVAPRLFDLYNDLGTPLPLLAQTSPTLTWALITIAVLSALYFILSKPDYSKVELIASKYKAGEMIKTRELVDKRYEWAILSFMVIGIGYLAISIIVPISSLTTQYQ